jgi:hypothetical protein
MSRVDLLRDPFGLPAGFPEQPWANWPRAERTAEICTTDMVASPRSNKPRTA